MLTYDPDIYQSHRYYVPCRPDFADLEEIARQLSCGARPVQRDGAGRQIGSASGQWRDRILAHFIEIFDTARFWDAPEERLRLRNEFMPSLLARRNRSEPVNIQIRTPR